MILLDKPLTREHLIKFKNLTIDAKLDMLDARPGWSYRGPVMNGKIYLDYQTWESSKYYAMNKRFGRTRYQSNNYGFKRRKHSVLDNELDFLQDEDLAVIDNWNYCLSFDENNVVNHNVSSTVSSRRNILGQRRSRLDAPAHALFISDNTEWLLEASKRNLEDADYEVLNLSANITPNSKIITMSVEDMDYIGKGSTMALAALDLYGRTHSAQYETKRPSFSLFSSASNVNITDLVMGEETLEISDDCYVQNILKDNDFHRYCKFISGTNTKKISDEIGEEWTYWGCYHLAEGDYHIVQEDSVFMRKNRKINPPLFI